MYLLYAICSVEGDLYLLVGICFSPLDKDRVNLCELVLLYGDSLSQLLWSRAYAQCPEVVVGVHRLDFIHGAEQPGYIRLTFLLRLIGK